MTRQLSLAMIVTIALSATSARAGTWVETGDAGDLVATGQHLLGTASNLFAIEGTIGQVGDIDLFRIYIFNPAAFSASTSNPGTVLTEDSDTQLFLFDLAGIGLIANDDDPADPAALTSALTAGSLSGLPGYYWLGIATFETIPLSALGAIFPSDPRDEVVGPTGPGGLSALIGWDTDPNPPQTGDYRIEITGAWFDAVAPVPEPSSVILLGVGALGLALFLKRRRTSS